jgi:hypothetical protein
MGEAHQGVDSVSAADEAMRVLPTYYLAQTVARSKEMDAVTKLPVIDSPEDSVGKRKLGGIRERCQTGHVVYHYRPTVSGKLYAPVSTVPVGAVRFFRPGPRGLCDLPSRWSLKGRLHNGVGASANHEQEKYQGEVKHDFSNAV